MSSLPTIWIRTVLSPSNVVNTSESSLWMVSRFSDM